MDLDKFDFSLPENLVALQPLENRASSKMIHFEEGGNIEDHLFSDIIDLVNSGDVLVFNNTKVIKARLKGNVEGRKAEVTLIKNTAGNTWQALAKPGKIFKEGRVFDVNEKFSAKIVDKNSDGTIELNFLSEAKALFEDLEKYGEVPLPPYIEKKRPAENSDQERYQTVYAKKAGAVAAPTAGLHFTDEIINSLMEKGVKMAEVTLHVGAGTFLPIRVDNIEEHKMHSEFYEIDKENADTINKAKNDGGRVIAVGTTSLRALESASKSSAVLSKKEETDIFIYPGYKFKIVDCLITNFHLPKSTLFILICAFIGTQNAQRLYKSAIDKEYRFFSYGDSCFIEKSVSLSS